MKTHEERSALTIFMKAALQQGGIKQPLQRLETLLFPWIRPTRPSLEVVGHGTMQQANGVGIQVELKPWSWIGHEGILVEPRLDATDKLD